MITIGFRFGNKVWKGIEKGLDTFVESGAADALGNTFQNAANAFGGNGDAVLSTHSVSSSHSDVLDKSGSNIDYIAQYQNWERRAEANYNSLVNLGYSVKDKNGNRSGGTGQKVSPSKYTQMKKLLREAQSEMRKIRLKASKNGVTIEPSKWETATVNY